MRISNYIHSGRNLVFLLLLASCSLLEPEIIKPQSIEVIFTPNDDALEKVIAVFDEAESEIHVAQFDLKYKNIAGALVRAQKRGVDVKVLCDPYPLNPREKKRLRAMNLLSEHNVDVRIAAAESTGGDIWEMHNKYVIVDDKTVQMGSANFTLSAFNGNYENIIVVRNNRILAAKFEKNFKQLWDNAEPYKP